jgi:hypothetical protein
MRRALNARDKGCVVCGAPPIHCDAHHLRSWIDGGDTAIHNLVLLCRRHHSALHNGHWTITITEGRVHVSLPSWADPSPPVRTRTPSLPSATTAARRSDHRARTPAPANGTPPAGVGPGVGVGLAEGGDPAADGAVGQSDAGASGDGDWARPRGGKGGAEGTSRRASRWSADEKMMEEAARFALWGETSADQTSAGQAPAGQSSAGQRSVDQSSAGRASADQISAALDLL